MMVKDNVFFGESGLTSTSANHIANLAKEFVKSAEAKLSSFNFLTEEVALIGCDKQTKLAQGMDASVLTSMRQLLDQVVEAKALIAWLREAIKTKDKWIVNLEAIDDNEYERLTGLKLVVKEKPVKERAFVNDPTSFLSVEERADNLIATQLSTLYSEALADGGCLANALMQLHDAELNPIVVNNADKLITESKPSVSPDAVQSAFSAFNDTLADMNKRCAMVNLQITEYRQQTQRTESDENSEFEKDNAETVNAFYKARKQYILAEKWRIAHLKIIIPNDLKPIYEKVSNLGKH